MRDPHVGIRRLDRRGVVFVAALVIVIVLAGLVVALAHEVRVESMASANRLAVAKADAVELGAEQWVLAQVTLSTSDAVAVGITPAEGLQVGNGYFWVIKPNLTDPTQPAYGITDECGKLNISYATQDQLLVLPGMTEEMAAGIVEWRGGAVTGGLGPGSTYYSSLAEPYREKLAAFESVEELLLVKDVTAEFLYGQDRNRDGVLSDLEKNSGTQSFSTGGTTAQDDGRGWMQHLTVYSPLSTAAAGGGGRGGGAGGGGGGGRGRSTTALVNVCTASSTVLQCLGMSQSDADSLVDSREATIQSAGALSGTTWMPQLSSSSALAGKITSVSTAYSADIVAASADGRGFRRVRIVVSTGTTGTAPKIVYRRDLTEYGWPLPAETLQSLKDGKGPNISSSNQSGATIK